MKSFLKCDIESVQPGYQQIIDELRTSNPGFLASLTDDDIFIHALEVKVTTCCTLHCRYCTHLVPYVSHPDHFNAQLITDCLKKLLSVSKAGILIFLGGEAFLHPQIAEIVSSVAELITKENVGAVRVTTNGTVIPSDEFCREFKKLDKGYAVISDYGELSAAKEDVYDKLSEYGIPVQRWVFTDGWRSLGDTAYKGYTEDEAKHLFQVCHGKIYYHLYNGHLYHCYRSPVINEDC